MEYDYTSSFTEGLAVVERNGKRGFIDKANQVVIPFEYDHALSFKNDIVEVTKNGKTFYINKQNQCVKDCP